MPRMRFLLIQLTAFRMPKNTDSKKKMWKKNILFLVSENHQLFPIIVLFLLYVREYVWWKPVYAHLITPNMQLIFSHCVGQSDLIGI